MRSDRDTLANKMFDHAYFSREASRGGRVIGGGGVDAIKTIEENFWDFCFITFTEITMYAMGKVCCLSLGGILEKLGHGK